MIVALPNGWLYLRGPHEETQCITKEGRLFMKRFVIIVLAVLMLGLSIPKQSEANGAWVPAVIIGSFFWAAIHAAAHASPVYPSYAPGQADVYGPPAQAYVYRPPAQVYVNPRPVNQDYYRYGHGYRESRQGYGRYRGRSVPPQYGWGISHR